MSRKEKGVEMHEGVKEVSKALIMVYVWFMGA
jgi:hypothetical protein